jgi:hypothetical protein
LALNSKILLPDSKLNIHEPYCRRNNIKCEKCGQFLHKDEMKEHLEEAHRKAACSFCKVTVEEPELKTHEILCPKAPKLCHYCSLKVGTDEFDHHSYVCGSRTNPCMVCQRPILLRDLEKHESTCFGIVEDQNSKKANTNAFGHTEGLKAEKIRARPSDEAGKRHEVLKRELKKEEESLKEKGEQKKLNSFGEIVMPKQERKPLGTLGGIQRKSEGPLNDKTKVREEKKTSEESKEPLNKGTKSTRSPKEHFPLGQPIGYSLITFSNRPK